jgi:hypothetical protein
MALPAGRYGVTKEQLRKVKRLPINTIGMITETKQGIARIEDGSMASALIPAGTQIWHNGKLYMALSDIAKDVAIVTSGEEQNVNEMPPLADQLPGTDAEKANEITIARVENGTTASADIAEGEQFYHNNVLYTATTTISSGSAIVTSGSGQNCELAPTVTGQIAESIEHTNKLVGWTGKNLCKGLETGSINQSTGQDQTGTNKRTIGIVSIEKGSTVTISGFNSDSTPQYRIFYYANGVYQSNEVLSYDNDTLSGTVTVGSTIDGIRCQITPAKVDDTKFMVEYGTVATTYEPYHASVEESKCDNTVIAPVENQSTCQKSGGYSANDLFIHDGGLCKATTTIAEGATLTEGTNYTKTSVGEILTALLNA